MKANFFSGKALLALCISASLFTASCSKDNDSDDNTNAETYAVSGNGSGSQVVPSVTTTATSSLTGTYTRSNRNLQYNVSWTGLVAAANAVRFYGPASAGSNASGNAQYDITINSGGISGTSSGNVTLTAEQEADLLANKWYYTVGNATYVTGEVRGQIMATAQ